ncbi:MAG: HDOD domain-containing protein [Planctomycetaceae bacterium]|nr:HDOD domain-containing protein [Planctomycetaceae bacterium]
MHRILFVDDEPKILTGLQRMLRNMRREWEMSFAEGGPQALRMLRASPFDVLVTDARMPGIEGAELLEIVRRECPDTVRIILSGQCSRDSLLRCVGVAHQFLSKPCDSEILKDTVQRVCRLRNSFDDQEMRATISAVASLPSVVSTYEALQAQAAGEASLRTVGETIASDVAMSAKVLQLVSSGFLGSPQGAIEMERAIELLGAETFRALAAQPNVFRPIPSGERSESLLRELTVHSLAVAAAAKQIAESATGAPSTIVQSRVAGMLHKVGTLVSYPLESTDSCMDRTSWDAPASPPKTCCAQAGGYLASLWGLPAGIVEAIGCHRSPHRSGSSSFSALTAVHVANAFVEAARNADGDAAGLLDHQYLARVGCTDRLDEWREICHAACFGEVLQ